MFETDENGILTGRYFGRCNVKDYQNGYMPKGKKELALEVFAQSVDILIESDKVSRSIRTTKDYDLVNIAFYDLAESLQKKADRMKK